MKNILILAMIIGLCFFSSKSFTQIKSKPALDSLAIVNWPTLGDFFAISNNGEYMYYTVEQRELGKITLYVKSVNRKWQMEVPGVMKAWFSTDSRKLYYYANDSLSLIELGKGKIISIPNVTRIQQPENEFGNWIAYQTTADSSKVILNNIVTGKSEVFDETVDFSFSPNANTFLITAAEKNGLKSLYWVALPTMEKKQIWLSTSTSQAIETTAFDSSGSRLAFVTVDNSTQDLKYSLHYYHQGMTNAELKADKSSVGKSGLTISENGLGFSVNGKFIFFQLKKEENKLAPDPDAVSLDVWNYKDKYIQSYQLKQRYQSANYAACISIEEKAKVIQLTNDNESIETDQSRGDYTVIKVDSSGDRFWLTSFGKNSEVGYYIVSLINGSRTKLNVFGHTQFFFSPSGKTLIYFNKGMQRGHYNCYSLDLDSKRIIQVSNGGIIDLFDHQTEFDIKDSLNIAVSPSRVGAWSSDEKFFFIDDIFDIWRVNTTDQSPPQNITTGYGRNNRIKLRLLKGMDGAPEPVTIPSDELVILTGFNIVNKQNSFFQIRIGQNKAPEKLSSGNWVIYRGAYGTLPPNQEVFDRLDFKPIKSKYSNIWLISRQSAKNAQNFFVTKDFKEFKALTDLHPEEKYNWLTAELVSFPMEDGTFRQGVLYKPENFDSTKKYPVIFHYYEQLSHRLHEYPLPKFIITEINVAWFVSRGYLVFNPDIYFHPRKDGLSAYTTVTDASNYLSQFAFVDTSRMALNGHSHGGHLTNYIITHSNKFAAAVEGAGSSDWISAYLKTTLKGNSRMLSHESSTRGTLWEIPETYLDETIILKADKIKTPLLIHHSKDDGGSPFEQAVELFLALRRLNKPVWILQYDGQDHGNFGTKEKRDYTIRLTQFYDHYLMGRPAPRWMSQGIPARKKRIDRGLEIESK